MDSTIKVRAIIRNASASDIKALLAISEMANPELHIPLQKIHSVFSHEQVRHYKTVLTATVWTYLEHAWKNAESYVAEYENEVKLTPDKKEIIFQKYRNHHIDRINQRQQYSYLYTEYFKGEWTIDLLSAIADELWHIAYKYDEKLIEALFLLQRIYSHFWTVETLNLQRDLDNIVHSAPSQVTEIMNLKLDKEYFLPVSFEVPRHGRTIGEVQNKNYGPSYKTDINGMECTVYTDRLNWFLQMTNIKVADIEANYGDVEIDGTSYRESYKNGFKEGLIDFIKKYDFEKIGSILGIDKYLETLKAIKFNDCKGPLWSPGLEGIRHSHIGTISHKIIKEHGYYAGMYSQIEVLMNDYEPIKKALLVYPQEYLSVPTTLTPPPSDEPVKLTHAQIAMLYHYNNQPVTRNNADEIARKYGQTSGQKLLDTYGRMTSPLERTADAKSTIKNFDKVIPLLSDDALQLANRELADAKKNNSKRLGK